MRWLTGELVAESVRRLSIKDVVKVGAAVLLVSALVLFAAKELIAAETLAKKQIDEGVTVFQIDSLNPELPLPSSPCVALQKNPVVENAGMIYGIEAVYLVPTGLEFEVTQLSLEAVRVWWPQMQARHQVVLGGVLAEKSYLSFSSKFTYDKSSTETFSPDVMLPATVVGKIVQATMMQVSPPQDTGKQCMVRVKAGYHQQATSLLKASYADHAQVQVTPFVTLDVLSADPVKNLQASSSLSLLLAALIVFVLVVLLQSLSSRAEVGIYRSVGTKRKELFFMAIMQNFVLVLAAGALTALVSVALLWWFSPISQTGLSLWFIVQPALLFSLAAFVLAPWVETLATTGAVVDQLKE